MSKLELLWQNGKLMTGEIGWFMGFALDSYFYRYLVEETLSEEFVLAAGCRYCPAIQAGNARHFVNYVNRGPADPSGKRQVIRIGCTGMDEAQRLGQWPPCSAGVELSTWGILLNKFRGLEPFDYNSYEVIVG